MEPAPPLPSVEAHLTTETVTKLIQDQSERDRKWLEFAQSQGKNDRDYFKHLFNLTYLFIGVIVAVVVSAGSVLGLRSIEQIRDEAKLTVNVEVAKVQAELQRMKGEVDESALDAKHKVQEQLTLARGEIKNRLDHEFQTEEITGLVRTVAKERTEQELNGVIRSEVVKGIQAQAGTIQSTVQSETKKAVKELEPTIATLVTNEASSQITKAVNPVRDQMKSYGEIINFTTLATLAKNGDRNAFDTLNNRVYYINNPGMLSIGKTIVADIIRQYNNNAIHMGLQFSDPKTGQAKTLPIDEMKRILEHSEDVNMRLAALDNLPQGDHSIVSLLVRVIEHDNSLAVVDNAFQVFNRETKQSFRIPDYAAVLEWWKRNRDTWK